MVFENAWIPYYYKIFCKYEKVKHLDTNQQIRNKLDTVYSLGGIVPLYTSYLELDKIKTDIEILYSRL